MLSQNPQLAEALRRTAKTFSGSDPHFTNWASELARQLDIVHNENLRDNFIRSRHPKRVK